jgi:hypothetical protein
MSKVPLVVVEMTKGGSELTDEELHELAEQMYNTMVEKMKVSRPKSVAADTDES